MSASGKISHIIFDFGNVLYNLDFDLFYKNLNQLFSVAPLSKEMEKVLMDYETGRINTETFIWKIQHFTGTKVLPNKIIDLWNSLLIDMPFHRLKMLNRLAKKYTLCMLSNINELHIELARDYVEDHYHIQDFEKRFFHHHFYSNEIGFRKPEPGAYQFVLGELGVFPEKVLFIDDLPENIEAARDQGWHAIQHDPKNDIAQYIDHYLSSIEN
jgi:putative hydrolase of the HAD superfamily